MNTKFVCPFFLFITWALADPIVELPYGKIQGREDVTWENKTMYAFQKVPYAAPPVGNLRFKPLQPHPGWDDVYDATKLDVICYQADTGNSPNQAEDCLIINIFTPELPTENKNVSLPVMFYIHGGSFIEGSSDWFTGDRFIGEGIVFTSITYRLGPFGFLSTEDDVIPGNTGLKDQQFALKWIAQNIHLFGGDPTRVTILGESAGSAAVAYHLLNQDNRDLFIGAIMQSGSALSPWALQRHAKETAFGFAALLNETFKTNRNSQDLLDYLMTVDAEDIHSASGRYREGLVADSVYNLEMMRGEIFGPVIEVKNPNAFLTRKMYKLFEAQNVVPVPLIIGINSEEALGFYSDDYYHNLLETLDSHLDWLVPDDMNLIDDTQRTSMGSKIRDLYTGGEPLVSNIGYGVRYITDDSFSRPSIKQADLFSKAANTYFYQFSYSGSLPGQKPVYGGTERVSHGEELTYMYCSGQGCDISSAPEGDQITSKRLIKLWSDFVKYQNPTPEKIELLQNVTWPLVDTTGGDFLYLDINEDLEIRNHPKEETYSGWSRLYGSMNYDDFDTY